VVTYYHFGNRQNVEKRRESGGFGQGDNPANTEVESGIRKRGQERYLRSSRRGGRKGAYSDVDSHYLINFSQEEKLGKVRKKS